MFIIETTATNLATLYMYSRPILPSTINGLHDLSSGIKLWSININKSYNVWLSDNSSSLISYLESKCTEYTNYYAKVYFISQY